MPDFSDAKISDIPRSTAPCETCVRPVPLPPAAIADCVPCTVSNSAATSLRSGCSAEEPDAEIFLPARVASFVPPAPWPPEPAVRSAAVAVQDSRGLVVVVPAPPVELVPHAARSKVAPSAAPMPSFVARERINVYLRAFTFPMSRNTITLAGASRRVHPTSTRQGSFAQAHHHERYRTRINGDLMVC